SDVCRNASRVGVIVMVEEVRRTSSQIVSGSLNAATQVGERDATPGGAVSDRLEPRAEFEGHPADLIHVLFASAVTLFGLLLATVWSDQIRDFDKRLFDFIAATPSRITEVFVEGVQLLAVLVPCVAIAVLLYLRRFRALAYALLAGFVTLAVTHFTVEWFE